MKALLAAIAALAVLTFGACKDKTEVQAEISKGSPEGQQLRKKYEAANKEAAEQRDKQDR